MEELVLRLENIEIAFNGKKILEIPQLQVYENQRIGIIGDNGSGKTTLAKLITGELMPDIGKIQREVSFGWFPQGGMAQVLPETGDQLALMSRLQVPQQDNLQALSGGEATKFRLAQVLADYQPALVMDEPTTHLDREGIEVLTDELRYYYGTLFFISHDRQFLNDLAEVIWEVADGKVTVYKGNFAAYQEQKELAAKTAQQTRENFLKEKQRIEKTIQKKQEQAQKAATVSRRKKQQQIKPDRLSASKQKDTVEKNLHKGAKAAMSRLERLEEPEKTKEKPPLRFPNPPALQMHNPFPIQGAEVQLLAGDKVLLEKADFQFGLGKKIALTGDNGTGKTTLLQWIVAEKPGIRLSPKVRFSVYQQTAYDMITTEPLLRYLLKETQQPEPFIRALLHNLDFAPQSLLTPIVQLSGGQRTRLAIASIFLEPANVLVLDEPTNFIDLATTAALEKLLKAYPGTVLFTSHDAHFVQNVADEVWILADQKLVQTESR